MVDVRRIMNNTWQKVVNLLWFFLIILLPVTSMPLVVRLVKSDTVAAPAGLALLLLVFLFILPSLLKGNLYPHQLVPLAGFFSIALFATVFSAFLPIPPFKEVNVIRQQLQAVVTLVVGICFYLIAATLPSDRDFLNKTIKWINWSGLVMLSWSLLQAAVWYRLHVYPVWMETIQRSLSTGVLYKARVSGFALEPSWLAHQLNTLYLPIWLACSVKRWSAHRIKIGVLTVENILLVSGICVMALTFSRVGMLAIVLMIAYLILKAAIRFSIWTRNKIMGVWSSKDSVRLQKRWRAFITGLIIVFLIMIVLAMLFGLAYAFSQFDPRMSEVFSFRIEENNTLLRYAYRLDFAPRLVYWLAGWEIFNQYPWFGVGLGNAGFFFPEVIVPYGWNIMEISEMMYRSSGLTNIKSLWVRLLAETGITGFSFFIAWLFTLWQSASKLKDKNDGLFASMGLMGNFVIISLLVEGFSVDSFALPYYWIAFGLTTSAFRLVKNSTV